MPLQQPTPSSAYCSLAVLDPEALKDSGLQQKYEGLWGMFLDVAETFEDRLRRIPWMSKLLSVDVHNFARDRRASPHGAAQGCGDAYRGKRVHLSPEGSSPSSPSSVLSAPCLLSDDDADEDEEAADGDEEGSAAAKGEGTAEDHGACWLERLDDNSLDQVLSRLSLESLARLSCASKWCRGASRAKMFEQPGAALLDLRENLGGPYEPSMLRLPLRLADLPHLQRWDRYSIHLPVVSKVYQHMAAAFPGVVCYQQGMF